MDRSEFEQLRDLPEKRIEGNIVLKRKKDAKPLMEAVVPIINSSGASAKLVIKLNEQTDEKTLNVFVDGIGPICRLDVDSQQHAPAGRSHKHSLQEPDCPSANLPLKVFDRSDLTGRSIGDVFTEFCHLANINYVGTVTVEGT